MSFNKSSTFGPLPAWSSKSTSTWLFQPVSTCEDSTGLTHVRPTVAGETAMFTLRIDRKG
jgi:hypothetical protein